MRERFETAADKTRQVKLAKDVERTMGWSLRPLMNGHYSLDYFAAEPGTSRGKAWVEVKCRNIKWGSYPTIMLSAGKWRDGVSLAMTTGLDFWLFFRFREGDVWSFRYPGREAPTTAPHPTDFGPLGEVWCEYGGRSNDDRDGQDTEPVMHIPLKLWQPVQVVEATPQPSHPFDLF